MSELVTTVAKMEVPADRNHFDVVVACEDDEGGAAGRRAGRHGALSGSALVASAPATNRLPPRLPPAEDLDVPLVSIKFR